ncbi:MAG: sugar transferase [Clostridia bacterium]|nr:sugar transferase [Clostridia bacterium]
MYKNFLKRVFDIFLSFFWLIVLCIPMLIIAIVVACDSKSSALFVQDRIGRNGKLFKFYKFRSMRKEAPANMATRDIQGGEYITKTGKFLRRTSLDELPQLWCILKGDMSIIGPRPVVTTEIELFEYRKETNALKVRPGLTGLAQVEYRDSLNDMKKKAEIDGYYADNISFWFDVKIFFRTIKKVFRQDDIVDNACEDKVEQLSEIKESNVIVPSMEREDKEGGVS